MGWMLMLTINIDEIVDIKMQALTPTKWGLLSIFNDQSKFFYSTSRYLDRHFTHLHFDHLHVASFSWVGKFC